MNQNLMKLSALCILSTISLSACNSGSGHVGSSLTTKNSLEITPSSNDFKNLPEAMGEASKSAVMFNVLFQNEQRGHCTGVAIAKNKIITAAHCFISKEDRDKGRLEFSPIKKITVRSNPLGNTTFDYTNFSFSKQKYDNKKSSDDYVVLRIELNKSLYVKPENIIKDTSIMVEDPNKGKDVYLYKPHLVLYFIGSQSDFKGDCLNKLDSNYCQWQWNNLDLTTNLASGYATYVQGGWTIIDTNKKFMLEPGDSGGPVFACTKNPRDECKLIGITSSELTGYSLYIVTPTNGMSLNENL